MNREIEQIVTHEGIPVLRAALKETTELRGAVQVLADRVDRLVGELAEGERESGALVSLGDDLKAAGTDCLKKCATFLGVGLRLYAEKPISGRGPTAPSRPASAPRPPVRTPLNGTRPNSGQPGNGRPS